MKVSKDWLGELVEIKNIKEIERLLPLRTIATKEITDNFIELDMKGYNRSDLLSLRGVAREVAAITDSKVNFEDLPSPTFNLPEVKIRIENSDLCPVYCVAKIEGLKVEQSPESWIKKLNSSGLRSINNIADITNLIMLEFGQPMHAFDTVHVKDETLIVRVAKEDDELLTLDGKTRQFKSSDLLITDREKPLGLAGVMGGKDSEVTEKTTSIFLEAAIFDPISIRKTAQRHNLPSEASKRFQHGLTKSGLLQALSSAIKMYKSLGGNVVAISAIGDLKDKEKIITLRQDKLNTLIGIEIPKEQVETSLTSLGFQLKSVGEASWEVGVPYWRVDVEIEEDLIEEVSRMYGYEKIPAKPLEGSFPEKINQKPFEFISKLKNALVGLGLTEVQTYSFYTTDVLNNLQWDKAHLIKLANPISTETEYMREDVWPNLLEVAAKNLKQGYDDIAIFEIGRTYHPVEGKLPDQSYRLSILLTNNSSNPIQELYQIARKLFDNLGISINLNNDPKREEEVRLFHPTRFSWLVINNEKIGGIAEIHPRIINKFGIDKRISVLEVDLSALLK